MNIVKLAHKEMKIIKGMDGAENFLKMNAEDKTALAEQIAEIENITVEEELKVMKLIEKRLRRNL